MNIEQTLYYYSYKIYWTENTPDVSSQNVFSQNRILNRKQNKEAAANDWITNKTNFKWTSVVRRKA